METSSLLSYSALTGYHTTGHHVEVSESQFRDILQLLLQYVIVDEAWYRSSNEDVDQAIAAGEMKSAKEHYTSAGYFEDRMPRPLIVDEDWYLQAYTDVAEAVRNGVFASAQEHFISAGFREGRVPRANWSLLSGSNILQDRSPGSSAGQTAGEAVRPGVDQTRSLPDEVPSSGRAW
jgi:hypothetical protein